jgi:hemerythrin-like domain-containing protein
MIIDVFNSNQVVSSNYLFKTMLPLFKGRRNMKPIGPLMREHRLIERMVNILEKELMNVKDSGSVDTTIVSKGVDFFRTYADRTHHGKEEDILFKQLSEKNLTLEHKKMMNKLIADHAYARKTVGALKNANASVAKGNNSSTQEVISNIEKLVELYPRHIFIEDKEFFYPILEYFSKEEQEDMLEEFRKFDRKMIHEKYTKIVDDLEQ